MNARSKNIHQSISLFFAVLLILFAALPTLGQNKDGSDVPLSADLQAEKMRNEVARLLQSGESKESAWAAYLIGKHNLRDYVPILIEMLAPAAYSSSHDQYLVNRVALDSLIQLDAAAPAEKLLPLVKEFTDEVVILLVRSPEENRDQLLSLAQTFKSGVAWIAVCNLLAEIKAAGFAAYLLKDLKINVSVSVTDANSGGGSSIGTGCGGLIGCGGVGSPPLGFPPMYYYKLTDYAYRGAVVVVAGKRTIYYQRSEGAVPASCGGGAASERERLEYLASMLGTTREDFKLDYLSYSIEWKGLQGYTREMARVRSNVKALYQSLINRLIEHELLTLEEVAELKPNVSYYVEDYRSNKSVPLPGVAKQ